MARMAPRRAPHVAPVLATPPPRPVAGETSVPRPQYCDNPETANFHADPEARRKFWERAGIYKRYNEAEVEYINKIIIPSLAASLVASDYNGLLCLWQALNGVDAIVGSGVLLQQPDVTGDISRQKYFPITQDSDRAQVMEAFNGSTLALRLLYQVAGMGLGTGAGDYGFTTGVLLDYTLAAIIPGPAEPGTQAPSQPEFPATISSTESFKWTYRITK